MKAPSIQAHGSPRNWAEQTFPIIFGAFLGLSLLKFGNPPIMEDFVARPSDAYELVLGYPWPISWAYNILAITAVCGILFLRKQLPVPRWLLVLPAIWLGWQFLSAGQSVDHRLSTPTVTHLCACAACFYLGALALSRSRRFGGFWVGLAGGFALVLLAGWEQRFGGLEQTRKYFYLYIYPHLKEVSPDYLKKISSDRIFATLFYPNALAGVILLLLPGSLGALTLARGRLTPAARWFLGGVLTCGALACLYWSGSKGGWLLMLVLGAFALWRLPLPHNFKLGILAMLVLVGLAGFGLKYAGFFKKGATSVSARFDYWEAAAKTAKANPVLGTGPGTFFVAYEKLRRPGSEPSRLVHNDYLEQASDSGIPGFLTYLAFVSGAMVISYRKARTAGSETDWLRFSVWLGLLGWALQGLLEFGLYIPGLAWPAFGLLGWLAGQPEAGRKFVDKSSAAH